jgi:hypothetical protein
MPIPGIVSLAQEILENRADETARRLDAAKVIRHNGERGRARETAVSDYLRGFLAESFKVGTGFVIDSMGERSRQQDLVIRRDDYHPVFDQGGVKHYPVESVACTVEVKSRLDTAQLK